MPHSSLAIANEFLKRALDDGKSLTHMHLQRLVFIAHGFNLAINHTPLIDEQYQAWEFGPIAPELYRALKRYGLQPVTRLIRHGDESYWGESDTGWSGDTGGWLRAETAGGSVTEPLTVDEKGVIDLIWADFRDYQSFQLSALTHGPKTPWRDFYEQGKTNPIPNNSIRDFFVPFAVDYRDATQG
jgi:uncharacterized phage-associated protein